MTSLRRFVAFALILATVVVAGLSSYTDFADSCKSTTQTTTTTNDAGTGVEVQTTQDCGPLQLTDAVTAGGILLGLLLLAPDLDELGIAGVKMKFLREAVQDVDKVVTQITTAGVEQSAPLEERKAAFREGSPDDTSLD